MITMMTPMTVIMLRMIVMSTMRMKIAMMAALATMIMLTQC